MDPSDYNIFERVGSGFADFPKQLPDDFVEYSLFVIDSALSQAAEIRARLIAVQRTANQLVKRLLKNYIWQRGAFELQLRQENGLAYLHGRTDYGDSIEDEWLMVYLLRELSTKFPDVWTRVVDSDGEFLLVEAANALPRWLNPEIADHRVWINKGRLLIIPPESKDVQTKKKNLSLEEALKFIRAGDSKMIHSPTIEEEAFYRLRNYPSQIETNLHHALLPIPRKLAFILNESPGYISPAIEAFYLRDPISLRPLQSQSPTHLFFPPSDFVTVSVTFTKVGYAQLKSQHFDPPVIWMGTLQEVAGASGFEQIELSMKLCCGFEMLLADTQNQDKKAVREIKLLLDDIESGTEELPSDQTIASWSQKQDDEGWLDINYEDFEKELAGRNGPGINPGGFADKTTQENLRKTIERFEQFLNDERAGPEGAEFLDDMDEDDDDDDDDDDGNEDDSDPDSEGEDKDISFDEEEFARLMREMMGLPSEDADPESTMTKNNNTQGQASANHEDEDEEMRKAMEVMEAELNEAGALNLDPSPSKIRATTKALKGKSKVTPTEADNDQASSDEEGDIDIDVNLARNLLESFKSQSGMAGPTGNLMGLMGVNLPRDEGDRN